MQNFLFCKSYVIYNTWCYTLKIICLSIKVETALIRLLWINIFSHSAGWARIGMRCWLISAVVAHNPSLPVSLYHPVTAHTLDYVSTEETASRRLLEMSQCLLKLQKICSEDKKRRRSKILVWGTKMILLFKMCSFYFRKKPLWMKKTLIGCRFSLNALE